MSRCQLCGRRLGTLKSGLIRSHHFKQTLCSGSGHWPIEECDQQLEISATLAAQREEILRLELAELFERRANWIEPRIYSDLLAASKEADRLGRRLVRHRAWPERFARQMEQQGWGDPPPAYLQRLAQ